jgi:phospholipid/cholesterol/gamma-HCH transport system substrate-binding protein
MRKINIETGVGLFIIVGLICLAYLSVSLGDVDLFGTKQYKINARFANISGLKEGASVDLGGRRIIKKSKIRLDDSEATVDLLIDPKVKLQEDVIASIRTQGIIGDKYIKIKTGGAEDHIEHDGEIMETESALELEELISKYIFEKE